MDSKMDPRIEKILVKLRRGSTSVLSQKAIFDALAHLGYSLEKRRVWRDAASCGLSNNAIEKSKLGWDGAVLGIGDRPRFHTGYDGKPAEYSIVVDGKGTKPNATRGITALEEFRAKYAALAVDELPAKVVLDKVVTTGLGEIETHVTVHEPSKYNADGSWHAYHRFTWRGYVGEPCTTVTCPDGNSYDHFKRVRSLFDLIGWLFKETLLAERASAALGLPTVEEEKAARDYKARDWTNTGTCPCCFGNFKMHKGRMVLHGYARPGHGYIIGRCFGVGFKPYEHTTNGTEEYRAALESSLEGAEDHLLALKNENFKGVFTVPTRRGPVSVGPDDKGWDATRKDAIREAELHVGQYKREIKFLTEQVEAWKPGMKMPEEIAKEGKNPLWQRSN